MLTLYPRMRPLRSVGGTSPHRTRMLLEVVANADTLAGPLEGTAARNVKVNRLEPAAKFYINLLFLCSPDSRVLPWTAGLQGPEPIPLMA